MHIAQELQGFGFVPTSLSLQLLSFVSELHWNVTSSYPQIINQNRLLLQPPHLLHLVDCHELLELGHCAIQETQ